MAETFNRVTTVTGTTNTPFIIYQAPNTADTDRAIVISIKTFTISGGEIRILSASGTLIGNLLNTSSANALNQLGDKLILKRGEQLEFTGTSTVISTSCTHVSVLEIT